MPFQQGFADACVRLSPTDQALARGGTPDDHACSHIGALHCRTSLCGRDFHRRCNAVPHAARHIAELLEHCEEIPLAGLAIRSFPATAQHTGPC